MKKRIAVLGSTGSIGKQALEVIAGNDKIAEIELLTAYNNAPLLIEQALKFNPNAVVIGNELYYKMVKDALSPAGVKVFAGEEAMTQAIEMETIDLVLTAVVGFSGLRPTLKAIECGKQIALSNKETLVVAGELITSLAQKLGVNIYPVDSEHSAIFQCLAGEFHNKIEKIYLTASGGPFRNKSIEYLSKVTKLEALKHPNWNMGNKVTIDSASLMNKGLEVIEAMWLFGLKKEQIEVVVHPQSIIHSIVQFEDGSMKAQMGLPDMKLPIQYALFYPERVKSNYPRFNFTNYPELTFEKPDLGIFKNLSLAYTALEKGGNMPCILNASNEIVVSAFLNDRINFIKMPEVIEKCMQKCTFIQHPALEDYYMTDIEARQITNSLI